MDLGDLPAYLKALQDAAASAVAPAANAMAGQVQDRVQALLRETSHPPYTFFKAVAGRPPAYASGNLAKSVVTTPAYGAVRATASVGSHLRYSALQEWGGVTWPSNGPYMFWKNPRPWWKKRVTIPEHPYFRPAVEQCIDDGSLTRVSMDAFYDRVSAFFNRGG
jgi:phage gpG-like protein